MGHSLCIDFETKARADLKKTGARAYAADPDTAPLCACFAVDDGPVRDWLPGQPCPPEIVQAVREGWTLRAWNAQFEMNVWRLVLARRHSWPDFADAQWRCTMAAALALALPGSLENAAGAVGLPISKDMEGRRLMLQMSRPRRINEDGSIQWWDDPDKLERLVAYCRVDVEVERGICARLLPLSDAEQRLWLLDWRINNRGIRIDMKAVTTALQVIEHTKASLNTDMAQATGGGVMRATNVKQLKDWLDEQGVVVDGLAKADLADLLTRIDNFPNEVREALLTRQEAAKASTAKLKAMRDGVDTDGRLRGLHQYHGANTGRWAGRRVQPQNFPKPPEKWKPSATDYVLTMLAGG